MDTKIKTNWLKALRSRLLLTTSVQGKEGKHMGNKNPVHLIYRGFCVDYSDLTDWWYQISKNGEVENRQATEAEAYHWIDVRRRKQADIREEVIRQIVSKLRR